MDEFEQGLKTAKEKFDGFSGKLSKAGETISKTGKSLTKWVTTPIVGLGTAIVKTGMDYEAGMSQVQAISGATADEMAMLGEKAMEMAAKTKFSTSDSAEAYSYMAMAGWKAGQMVDGISGIMNLAAASGEDLASTSDIVTDALTAFGLKAEDASQFADLLASVSSNANTNVSMMGETFKYVAPVAGGLGYSAEDTALAIGLMANSGIKASQAGTALRSILTRLSKPTKESQTAMDELCISLQNGDGSMKSLREIIGDLRDGFGQLMIPEEEFRERVSRLNEKLDAGSISEKNYNAEMERLISLAYGAEGAEKAKYAAMLAGQESMSGLLAIVSAAPEDYDKLIKSIENADEAAERMAETMQDNAAGAFERLKSAINVLFTQLSQHLLPIFTSIVEKLTAAVNWFGQLSEGTQKVILVIAGIAAAIGPVLLTIGKVITAVGTIGKAVGSVIGIIKGVGGAVSALFSLLAANPIVLIIAGVVALGAAFVALWNNCEEFRNFWISLWEKIKKVAIAAWEGIKKVFEAVAPYFKQAFSIALDAIKLVWDGVTGYFKNIWETIKGIFSVVKDVLTGDFKGAWEGIKGILSGWASYFQGLWNQLTKVFSGVDQFFGGIFSRAWQSVKNAWSNVKSFFSGIVDKIKNVFTSLPSTLLNIGRNMMEGLWNGIKSKFDWVKQKVQSAVDSIKGMFTGKKGFDTHSPSRWSRQLFENVMLGGGEGIQEGLPALLRDATAVADKIKNSMDFSVSPTLQANMSTGLAASAMQPAAASAIYGGATINITVNGAQYSDERALAQRIAQEIQFITDRRNAYAPA